MSITYRVNDLQCQIALVYNCNDDVATTVLISGLQVTHSFYKHLVKHEVTKTRDILTRTQKYMQIKDVTRVSANRSPKQESKLEGQ